MLENDNILTADDFLKAAADPSQVRDIDHRRRASKDIFSRDVSINAFHHGCRLCRMDDSEFRRRWAQIANGFSRDPHDVCHASLTR